METCNLKNHKGFTLIEVLAALAVLAIALSALVLANIENTSTTGHLKEKMVAHWVGMNIMAEVRLGLMDVPLSPKKVIGKVNMADKDWFWEVSGFTTEDKNTLKVEVDVGSDEREDSIIHLIGYLSQAEK